MWQWLEYGIDPDGNLVPVDRVRRGKTDLKCPYCQGGLTSKKGEIKAHHFAHTDTTCRAVSSGRDVELPLFDRFNLHLTPREYAALLQFEKKGVDSKYRFTLEAKDTIVYNPHKGSYGGWELTKLGKVICRKLSMNLFAQVQEPLMYGKLCDLEERVRLAYEEESVDYPDVLIDLKIYRDRVRSALANHLYYLKIIADGEEFYKIGVTGRTVSERTIEINADLKGHFETVAIEILGTWLHRGNLERYFIYKYERYLYRIGSHSEYFKLDEKLSKSVLRELRRIEAKEISNVERDLLNRLPSQVECEIEAVERSQQRRAAIKVGMARAKQWGTHVGRPSGSMTTDDDFLAKPSSVEILDALARGLSIRATAKEVGVSPATVQKVKAASSEKYIQSAF
ncbi:GIY-YIG nuclease family protein [Chamaesiphon minutus]|uniref:T5orf172 domain-containing protein n=1 Tax=Chamaesiphon minutus (strain ATCC 27169 / PCC 6605) TaxID=1173020 RepID=K9UDP9_CHAP6|nr:GIY-YIG nuclease family protein [Chamaesiphon minutus]AFY92955.1 T5orf172 domain-containing protein [Chamaesiphon minutus PCC 6605]